MKEYKVKVKSWDEGFIVVYSESEERAIAYAEDCDDDLITWVDGGRDVEID